MEIIGSSSDISDYHIQLGTHLKKTFNSAAAMFGPLSFIAMWQQHYQSIHAMPFLFSACHKLIDDNLGAVSKITKLGFPQNQVIRIRHGISVFKSQNCIFTQKRVPYS